MANGVTYLESAIETNGLRSVPVSKQKFPPCHGSDQTVLGSEQGERIDVHQVKLPQRGDPLCRWNNDLGQHSLPPQRTFQAGLMRLEHVIPIRQIHRHAHRVLALLKKVPRMGHPVLPNDPHVSIGGSGLE